MTPCRVGSTVTLAGNETDDLMKKLSLDLDISGTVRYEPKIVKMNDWMTSIMTISGKR